MTAETRALLADLLAWHINRFDAVPALSELKERTILLTGRQDLDEYSVDDIALRAHLIDAVQDYVDAPDAHSGPGASIDP